MEYRYFDNPWHDNRNELSPKVFKVKKEPIKSEDVMDFYEVLNDHQVPSVLAIIKLKNNKECVVGQYVTVEGAMRACFGKN